MNETKKLFCVVLLVLMISVIRSKALTNIDNTSHGHKSCLSVAKIGSVSDHTSRVGKEQKIAIEMAVQDHIFYTESFSSSPSNCTKLDFLIKDSHGKSARATVSAIDLIRSKHVQAIVGTLTSQEVALISESTHHNPNEKFPFISLSSPAIPNPATPTTPILFQIANDAVFQSQCIAALVGHFKWRKVTAIFEHNTNYGFSAATLTFLSDSLQQVNSEIQHRSEFPSLSTLSCPEKAVERELRKLKSKSNRVFVVFQFSLPSVLLLFKTAKHMGMMGKGHVWIVSDEIAGLLDSVDSSFKNQNMQGVVGVKTSFVDTSKAFTQFKRRFRRIYGSRYPEEEENSNPSIFALRAYDSIIAIAKAATALEGKVVTAKRLHEKLLSTNFRGLSGAIRFKNNGILAQSPTFEIVNVEGKSYREIAIWSKRHGFKGIMRPVYWPGGTVQTVPTGWALAEEEKPLKIAVPARGVFHQFVTVTYGQERNKTIVSGFSIDVFEAAVKRLPYQLHYELVPFNGSYDEMVDQVYSKGFDGAVGDIQIFADRFRYVEFTQPYVNSGLEMIVTVEPDQAKEIWMFKKVFSRGMWLRLALMHFFVCSVVSVIERQHHERRNHEPKSSGFIIWICVLLFSQREPLRCNKARLVFAPWMLVILVLMATFTASLSSMLTVSQIRPSVLDIETLKRTNATVACNGNSFIVKYLIGTLSFKSENIRNITLLDEYQEAFEKREIKAAFFVAPHAQVFLAKNCGSFIRSGTIFKLGGLGFAFPKGSPLAIDISEAVTEVTESKEVEYLENAMLSSLNNCSSSSLNLGTGGSIGPEPFSVLFIITAVISTLALIITLARLVVKRLERRFWKWAQIYCRQSSRTNALPTNLHTESYFY